MGVNTGPQSWEGLTYISACHQGLQAAPFLMSPDQGVKLPQYIQSDFLDKWLLVRVKAAPSRSGFTLRGQAAAILQSPITGVESQQRTQPGLEVVEPSSYKIL